MKLLQIVELESVLGMHQLRFRPTPVPILEPGLIGTARNQNRSWLEPDPDLTYIRIELDSSRNRIVKTLDRLNSFNPVLVILCIIITIK